MEGDALWKVTPTSRISLFSLPAGGEGLRPIDGDIVQADESSLSRQPSKMKRPAANRRGKLDGGGLQLQRLRTSLRLKYVAIALCGLALFRFHQFMPSDGGYHEGTENTVITRGGEEWKRYEMDCKSVTPLVNDTYALTSLVPAFNMSIHPSSQDNYVSASISSKGCFECEMVQKVQEVLSSYPDAYLLDVGGNIGMYSLAAAAIGRETFTLEPWFGNQRRICLSIGMNGGFERRVHVLPLAATETRTRFQLDIPGHNKGGTKVVTVKNESVTDDNLVEGLPISDLGLPKERPVVLKVDVEGHEMEALSGAKHFLCSNNTVIVLASMELRAASLKSHQSDALEIFKCLSKKGLVPYAVKRTPEIELDPNDLTKWIQLSSGFMDVMWYQRHR